METLRKIFDECSDGTKPEIILEKLNNSLDKDFSELNLKRLMFFG